MSTRARRLHERLAARRALQPLPLLAVLALIVLALSLAVRTPGLNAWDVAITRAVQRIRSLEADCVAITLTYMGSTGVLIAVAVAAAAVLTACGRKVEAGMVLLALFALPLNWLLKELVHRERPTAAVATIILPALGLSFPSGHAMGSATVYGSLAYVAWVIVPRRRTRRFLAAFLVVLALVVGMSRVYLGVHWFSDVLGGWTAGAFCIVLLAMLYRPVALSRGPSTD